MTKKLRARPLGEPLKSHPAYIAAREAKLTQLAIETPDCTYEECSDCCHVERITDVPTETRLRWRVNNPCPECDGEMHLGYIVGGHVDA